MEARTRTPETRKRTVFAPQPEGSPDFPAVISVELDEDESVEWAWTHTAGGESVVTGYTIVKGAEDRDELPV